MKKIILFLLISYTGFGQYKIEEVKLAASPYSIKDDFKIRRWDLDNNGDLFFIADDKNNVASIDKLYALNPQLYALFQKKNGYTPNYLPLSLAANTNSSYPNHISIDKNENVIISGNETNYCVFSKDNNWKYFFRLNDKNGLVSYFKSLYPTVSITALKFSWGENNINFNGNNFVSSSVNYDSLEFQTQTSICCFNTANDESLVYFGANGNNLQKDFFKGSNLKFEIGSGFASGERINVFSQPSGILESTNNKIYTFFLSSFNGNIFCEIDKTTKVTKLHKLGNENENCCNSMLLGKNNTVWLVNQRMKNHFSLFDGTKITFFNNLYSNERGGSGNYFVDESNNLTFFDEGKIVTITPEGQRSEKKVIGSNLTGDIKYDAATKTIWMKSSAESIFYKLTADNSVNSVFQFSIKSNGIVEFSDASEGNPTSWQWDFGDGTKSTEQNPTKTYTKKGKYNVTLTVAKQGVNPSTSSKEIEVVEIGTPPPIVRSIKITSPISGSKIAAIDPLLIKLELAAGTILANCKAEFLKLDGSLQKSLGNNVSGTNIQNIPFKINDVPTGDYYLKVSGVTQPSLKDSIRVTVQNTKFKPGVTLVTHGFQLFGGDEVNDFVNGTTDQIGVCAAIKKRIELEGGRATIFRNDIDKSVWIKDSPEPYRQGDEIILFYNWSILSNDFNDGALESAADNLFAMLAQSETVGGDRIPASLLKSDLQFHLIGHSRGNILLLQVLHRALKYFPNKKFHQFTLLDPHPAKPMNDINSSNELLSLPGVYGSPTRYPNEPNISLPSNVVKADVIYRQANAYEPLIDGALLFKSASIFNLFLFATGNFASIDWGKLNGFYGNFSGISVTNTPNKFSLNEESVRNGASNKLPHSGVHEWYRGTILPDNKSFEADGRKDWYTILPRAIYGYNNGRVAGNFETLRPIENAKALKDFEDRIISRTSFALNPIFNSNFQYKNYGWSGFGGDVKLLQDVNDKVVLRKPNSYNDGLTEPGFIPLLKHNYMYFNKEDSFLGIQISNVNSSAKLNIVFNSTNGEIGDITLRTSEAKTYFVKIPEELKGNVGNFAISLDKTTNLRPLIISRVYTTNSEIVEGEIASFNWRNEEESLTKNVFGVAADGTSRILIKVGNENQSSLLNTNRAAKVIVSLKDPDDGLNTQQYIGSLKPIDNLSQLTNPLSITHGNEIAAVSSQKINNVFYFDYQAPTDFGRTYEGMDDTQKSERSVVLEITLLDAGNQEIGRYRKNISIVRPPLMLAHGLGGKGVGSEPEDAKESTWREFKYVDAQGKSVFFRNSDLFLDKRDINLYPTASFDKNSDLLLGKDTDPDMQNESFDAMIKRMNDQGYACAKVDYVAHSMGGSVLRNTLEKPEYKNSKNYNQGYVNKFITICTPHQGSPLGDIVAEFSPYAIGNWSKFGVDIALLKESSFYDSKLGLAVPAVQNLAIRPENGGIKFPKQSIRNHTIIGNYVNKFSSDSEALQSLNYDKETRGFDYLTIIYAYAALKKLKECNCTKEFDELSKIVEQNIEIKGSTWASLLNFITNGIFPSFNVVFPKKSFTAEFLTWQSNRVNSLAPSFVKNSDLIVSVESQSAGRFVTWPKSFTSSLENPYTVYDGITHNFAPFKAIKDSDVGNRVFDLLNKSKNSVHFASDIAASPIIATPISCSPADCNTSIIQAESFIKLYPNPTPDFFNIDLTEIPEFDTGHLIIVDESGNKIHEMGIDKSCCKNLQVPFSRSGIYNVIVKTNNQTFTKKIVINK
jgi:hypothetical protein